MPISTKERCSSRAWLITLLCLMLGIPVGGLDRPAFHGGDESFELTEQHVIAGLSGNPAEATGYSTDPKQPVKTEAISPELLIPRLPQAKAGLRQTATNSSWHSRDHLPILPRPPCTL